MRVYEARRLCSTNPLKLPTRVYFNQRITEISDKRAELDRIGLGAAVSNTNLELPPITQ